MTARTKVRNVEQSLFPDIAPDKPVGYILPSVFVGSNADLMASVAPYYLTGSVLDVTYGEGAWWDRFRPEELAAHDKYKLDGVDFTNLPHENDTFDTVCYDPPYVLSGTDSRSAVMTGRFQSRYGIGIENLGHSRNSTFDQMLYDGLNEAIRCARTYVLVKCMEFAQGGGRADFKDVPYMMRRWTEDLDVSTHDVIVHHTGSGPGGHNIFDPKRARRHHSYLLVFRKWSA